MFNVEIFEKYINDAINNAMKKIQIDDIYVEDIYPSNLKMNVYKKKLENGRIEYKVLFYIPFASKDCITVNQLDENSIEVEVTLNQENLKSETEGYIKEYEEFSLKNISMKRKIVLPQNDEIKAKYQNGVLILTVNCGKKDSKKTIILE
ncbi:MAG: Hsp20 family protein [Patescibacteria group bacterium]|nr:Hsp20 family protein [Patescibacteria group bacterium]